MFALLSAKSTDSHSHFIRHSAAHTTQHKMFASINNENLHIVDTNKTYCTLPVYVCVCVCVFVDDLKFDDSELNV